MVIMEKNKDGAARTSVSSFQNERDCFDAAAVVAVTKLHVSRSQQNRTTSQH
jgi:hypothetical protein